MPNQEKIIYSEKRRARRVLTPKGSSTLIKKESGALDVYQLDDLSTIGMLFSDKRKRETYSTGLLFDDVYINVQLGDSGTGDAFFIFLGQSKIVRSFFDEDSQTIFYGMEFLDRSTYVKDRVSTLINQISPVTSQ